MQAKLGQFREYGFADLGRVIDPVAFAWPALEIRRRRFGADTLESRGGAA